MKQSELFLMSLCLVFISCSTKHNAIKIEQLGEYISSNVTFYESLTILSDSTFTYSWYNNPMKLPGETIGKIQTIKRKHYFTSQDQFIETDTMSNLDSDVIKIMIVDKNDNSPAIGASCTSYLNGKFFESGISEMDVTCLLNNSNVDIVKIEYNGYFTEQIDMNKYTSNSFKVYLSESHMSTNFRDTRIKFVKNELWLYENERLKIYTKM